MNTLPTGPMPNTTSDFWRMIWEKRLPNIVILTKCIEAGRVSAVLLMFMQGTSLPHNYVYMDVTCKGTSQEAVAAYSIRLLHPQQLVSPSINSVVTNTHLSSKQQVSIVGHGCQTIPVC